MTRAWESIDRAAQKRRERYEKLKTARTCGCGAWMKLDGEYHYRCPKCGERKLRKT